MAFGQSSGPPASPRQLRELLELVHGAGHSDFRDARGPLGLNQRQAAGKFTREEAEALIERLERDAELEPSSDPAPAPARLTAAEIAVRKLGDEVLAAELDRRGWIVIAP